MLKIKDFVNLKELEKFGYYEGCELFSIPYKYLYRKEMLRLFFHIEIAIYKETRQIRIIKWVKDWKNKSHKMIENFKNDIKYIRRLIRAGLVESVGE